MTRQHCSPLFIGSGITEAARLMALDKQSGTDSVSEADIQGWVQRHPGCLPVAEIDPMFVEPVPICTELRTPAGSIDNFMVTASGLPVLVECKLWRNPEARREVVGQILDYAKELSRWSSADLQRAVKERLGLEGNPLLARVREVHPGVDEIQFNDALTHNLRRGRFLLLIVGDGIREGVEAIAEYLHDHVSLHFTLGLVELPVYEMPNGIGRLVVPRVLAHTKLVTRNVVALPDGLSLAIEDSQEAAIDAEVDPDRAALMQERLDFWSLFLQQLRLTDPEQQIPKASRKGWLGFMLPAPNGSSWLTVYRDLYKGEVGIFLSSNRNTAGEYAMETIAENWAEVRGALGGNAKLTEKDGRPRIIEEHRFAPLSDPQVQAEAFAWLADRLNAFVNVLRPLVRSAAADYEPKRD
jgi:hypothetical protein